jgi:tetratricopeptide (TPR) repeat protein
MVRDYAFTGCGLASTPMVLSSYLFLAHVPLHPHVHNLFLQIALEQGAPGLVAFLGSVTAAVVVALAALRQADPHLRPVARAVLASLVALLVYGAMESDLYDGPFVFCLFLPLGFAWALASRAARAHQAVVRPTGAWRIGILSVLAVGGGVACMTWWPAGRAQVSANLGALAQTRAELSAYQWPRWNVQDEVRRAAGTDLEPAVEQFRSALWRDPMNVTARRRLGQIALSRGEYGPALEHLEAASAGAPDERPTRQLLGEARAVTGNVEGAVRAWSAGTTGEDLELRHWWYAHIGADAEARRMREAIDLLGRAPTGP